MKIQLESEKETKMSGRKQAKRWLITYPRSEGVTRENIREVIGGIGEIREIIVAEEKHGDGGIHHHVYVEFEKEMYWNAKTQPKKWDVQGHHPNVQTARNRKKTIEYVTKEDESPLIEGVDVKAVVKKEKSYAKMYEMGIEELKDQVHPMNLSRTIGGIQLYKLMRQDARETEECKGIWIQGPPGCGKSHLVEKGFPGAYRKAQNKWWDGYQGEEVVILEDLDGPYLNHYLKIWADKWRCTGEVKGAVVPLMHKWIIVTSNYTIRDIVEMGAKGERVDFTLVEAIERRFKVITMRGEEDRESAKEELGDIITGGEEEEEIAEPANKKSPN